MEAIVGAYHVVTGIDTDEGDALRRGSRGTLQPEAMDRHCSRDGRGERSKQYCGERKCVRYRSTAPQKMNRKSYHRLRCFKATFLNLNIPTYVI